MTNRTETRALLNPARTTTLKFSWLLIPREKPNYTTNRMKTSLSVLLSTIAFTFTTAAAPPLLIKATITGLHDNDVLSVPAITVESGHKALIQLGWIQYGVTPTLLDAGRVALRAVVTQPDRKNTSPFSAPLVTTDLGKAAEIQLTGINIAVTCTLLE